MRCMDCGVDMRETTEPITEKCKGQAITVTGVRHYVCDSCGEYELAAEDADELSRALATEYARIQGLLLPVEIRTIREQLGMTQVQFESLLGVSTPTASRWETGAAMPSKTACNLMRIYAAHPELAHGRPRRNGVVNLTDGSTPICQEWKVIDGGGAVGGSSASHKPYRKEHVRWGNIIEAKEG